MRKILLGLAATATLAAPLALAAPANAGTDSPGCVTRAEYLKVNTWMTQAQVHRIFDTRGKVTSQYHSHYVKTVDRDYKMCNASRWSWVSVYFSNNWDGGQKITLDGKYWARI